MTVHAQGASGCTVISNLGLPLVGGIVHQPCELGDQGAFEVFEVFEVFAVCIIDSGFAAL
jgi:hypothetical protein